MAQSGIPSNQILWDNLVNQAKAKYPAKRSKGLSFAAAGWVKSQYESKGGQYVQSKNDVEFRDVKKEMQDKAKRRQAEIKRKKKLNHEL
jgi:hypothetical protein